MNKTDSGNMRPWDDEAFENLDDDELDNLWTQTKGSDYIFDVRDNPDDFDDLPMVSIAPAEFFNKEKVEFHGHLQIDHILGDDYSCEMEGTYTSEIENAEAIREDLRKRGLKDSKEFSDYISSLLEDNSSYEDDEDECDCDDHS